MVKEYVKRNFVRLDLSDVRACGMSSFEVSQRFPIQSEVSMLLRFVWVAGPKQKFVGFVMFVE